MTEARPAPSPGVDDAEPRRPYTPPRLHTYGPIHRVARQFGPGPLSDRGNNMMAPFVPPPS